MLARQRRRGKDGCLVPLKDLFYAGGAGCSANITVTGMIQ